MLLKIVYGVGQNLYFTDVKTISFVAHHADAALPIDLTNIVETGNRVVYSDDFLKEQIGCSPVGTGDNTHYFNRIFVTTKNGEEEFVMFTGTAYLCDDKGNTVDTLR